MKCPHCGQDVKIDLADTSSLDKVIQQEYGWQELWYIGPSDEVAEPRGYNSHQRTVEIIAGIEIEVLYAGSSVIGGDYQYNSEDVMILFVLNGETYKKSGSYQSYDGTRWDGKLVKAQQVTKTITVWE